jgi:diguanylate cyclase (GGDEF)-like protein/PAS domain S-box-containing protein
MWAKASPPLKAVIKMAMVILGVELLIMLVIDSILIPFFNQSVTHVFWEFLDPILLTMIVAPVLNILVLRPMRAQQSKLEQQQSELRIASVAFESQNGMLITDLKGAILRVNPAFVRLTGYSAEEAVGKSPSMLKSGRHSQFFYQQLWESLQVNGYWQGEIWNKRKNGKVYAEMLNITAIRSSEQGITHYVGSFFDITENKEAEAEIHRLAYYDTLTKLPNRRLLQDRIGQALAATARSGLYGAVFLIDLDHFKKLNDTRGHVVGDQLLFEIAQRLRAKMREVDTVARQGGDEFIILMEDLSAGMDEAIALTKLLANKLREAIELPFNLNGYEYYCNFSIGVSLLHKQDTIEDLLKHADLALYQAKNAGRNTLRFFDPAMQAALDLRNALEAELRHVLRLNQLVLYYQPQVDINLRVIGVEALIRWQHPDRGLVPPVSFIPLAEDTGLILPIGLWVLETACNQLKIWENERLTSELQIAVNVSARQFHQLDFVAQVQNALATSGANPMRLKLELTESLALEDVVDTIEKMQAIKRLGVIFSMDDFGTGYSSLSYLAKLPLDQLKIDKAFVCNLPGNSNDEAVARAIITLGRELDMDVIAEGVETREQQAFLEMHGCHAYQGYLFSKPLPIDALEMYLKVA